MESSDNEDTLPLAEVFVGDENVPIENPVLEVDDPLGQDDEPVENPPEEVDLDNPFEPIQDVEPEASQILLLVSCRLMRFLPSVSMSFPS